MLTLLLSCLALLGALFAGAALWVGHQSGRLPYQRPSNYLEYPERQAGLLVVCAGDSNTQGRAAASYVDLLQRRRGQHLFLNAGVNGELTWNLRQRLGEIAACRPDAVTVLIGTNDATASLSDKLAQRAQRRHGVPYAPTLARFREELDELCRQLQEETDARIALLSPPPIGEDPDSPAWARARDFAVVVREVALQRGVTYLPLHERLCDVLAAEGRGRNFVGLQAMHMHIAAASAQRYLLGRGWDDIAARSRQRLLCDPLHINDRAAGVVADLVQGFLADEERAES